MSPTSTTSVTEELLQKIPALLRKNGMQQISESSSLLTTGKAFASEKTRASASHSTRTNGAVLGWQERLEQGEVLAGKVVEYCVTGSSWGTSVALAACRNAQRSSRHLTGQNAWCAFVDPTASLYAPGVQACGVALDRLLVVRPNEENLARVALRLVESRIFEVVVVDLMGLPGTHFEINLSSWVKVVRRMSMTLEKSRHSVVLVTDKNARRPLTLPVAQRIELARICRDQVQLCIPKNTQGAFLPPTKIRWDVRTATRRETTQEEPRAC